MEENRKFGSSVLAFATGVLIVVLAVCIFMGWIKDLKDHKTFVEVGSTLTFGGVLIWWSVSNNLKKWGIGFPTVTMVVGVVTAVVAILTLMHP